jgi:hypothetical protein
MKWKYVIFTTLQLSSTESLKLLFYEFWVKGKAGKAESESRGFSNIHYSKGQPGQNPLHDYTH